MPLSCCGECLNYLAHILLGEAGGCSPGASLLGDFAKGRVDARYTGDLLAGIRLHRRLDTYVDAHPAHRAARSALPPPWRRYGGILMDIYFDHLLACSWERWHPQPLAEYALLTYAQLEAAAPQFPAPLQALIARARSHALLTGYGDSARIVAALRATGARLRRPVPLHQAMPALEARRETAEQALIQLIPDALNYAYHAGTELRQATPHWPAPRTPQACA